jgi:uncharacterized membrane protein
VNPAHLHLVLNHLPILGVLFGTLLLVIGFVRKNRVVQQTALATLALAALAAGATYLTGEGAEEAIENRLANEQYVEHHEDAALLGLGAAGLAGAIAVFGLVSARKGRTLSRRLVAVNLAVAIAASGTLLWVANLGGRISHPEIRGSLMAVEQKAVEQKAVEQKESDDDH